MPSATRPPLPGERDRSLEVAREGHGGVGSGQRSRLGETDLLHLRRQPFKALSACSNGLAFVAARKGGRAVECTGLENRQAGNPRLGSSNLPPSVLAGVRALLEPERWPGLSVAVLYRVLHTRLDAYSPSASFHHRDSPCARGARFPPSPRSSTDASPALHERPTAQRLDALPHARLTAEAAASAINAPPRATVAVP